MIACFIRPILKWWSEILVCHFDFVPKRPNIPSIFSQPLSSLSFQVQKRRFVWHWFFFFFNFFLCSFPASFLIFLPFFFFPFFFYSFIFSYLIFGLFTCPFDCFYTFGFAFFFVTLSRIFPSSLLCSSLCNKTNKTKENSWIFRYIMFFLFWKMVEGILISILISVLIVSRCLQIMDLDKISKQYFLSHVFPSLWFYRKAVCSVNVLEPSSQIYFISILFVFFVLVSVFEAKTPSTT